MSDKATPFSTVLEEELAAIEESRILRDAKEFRATIEPGKDDPFLTANKSQLFGLAFSGGGIRSATFNLGVLQGLAKNNLLHEVDYLSTVSGGGYIGSWLTAWIRRTPKPDEKEVLTSIETELRTDKELTKKKAKKSEPDQIKWLRKFSNYLTPKKGLLGADTWTLAVTYVRNLFLNLLLLVVVLAGILMLPRLLVPLFILGKNWNQGTFCLATVLLLVFVTLTALNLAKLQRAASKKKEQTHFDLAVPGDHRDDSGKCVVHGFLVVRAGSTLPGDRMDDASPRSSGFCGDLDPSTPCRHVREQTS